MVGQGAEYHFQHDGHCPACAKDVRFTADGPYFRSTLKCSACDSRPRQRALMYALEALCPNWRAMRVHESSPGWDIVSRRLAAECGSYVASQYDATVAFGSMVKTRLPCGEYRSVNLEDQVFADACFDIVVTQDVFEHIFHPDLAIKEISRTLAPGGLFVSTIPIVQQFRASRRRARLEQGNIVHLLQAEYHGNPIDSSGSLVTLDWGFDVAAYLQRHSDLAIYILKIQDADIGVIGELTEVVIGRKIDQAQAGV